MKELSEKEQYFFNEYRRNLRLHNRDAKGMLWSSHERAARLWSWWLEGADAGSLLDIGCGSGLFLEWYNAQRPDFVRYVGVDAVPEMVNVAQKRVQELGISERVSLYSGFFPGDMPEVEMFDHVSMLGTISTLEMETAKRVVAAASQKARRTLSFSALSAEKYGGRLRSFSMGQIDSLVQETPMIAKEVVLDDEGAEYWVRLIRA